MTAVEKRIVRNEGSLPDRVPPNYFEDDSEDTEDDFENLLSALNKVKDLVRKSREQKQSLNEKLKGLSQEMRIESTRSESLTQNVEKLGHKVDELTNFDSLKTMRDQLDNLNREWEIVSKSFKSDDKCLYDFGKIAVYVEQAMCSYVLPEALVNGADANLHNLLNFLNSNDKPFTSDPDKHDCESLCAAKKRWGEVCENLDFPEEWKTKSGEWDVMDYTVPGDIRAIEVLKCSQAQVSTNEKPVSLKNASQNVESIRDKLPLWQFELVAAFIGSLKEKMTSSGLHHDYLDLS